MAKKITVFLLFALVSMSAFSQSGITLSFTGVHDTSYIQIDSLVIVNQTQNCDTTLVWPDTLLHFTFVGLPELKMPDNNLKVFQNHPNPFNNKTTVLVSVPEKDEVSILITDFSGRSLISQSYLLEQGTHSFNYTAGNSGMYVFSALTATKRSSIKLTSTARTRNNKSSLAYTGKRQPVIALKASNNRDDFVFSPGDKLVIKGYHDHEESAIVDFPTISKVYALQFAYNIPCPGLPSIEYGGQIYNTVQIFNQCWLAENLNYASGNSWCYDNDTANCETYGRLYSWETALNVCPDGWILPSDNDWNILEGGTDKLYSVGDPEWENLGWRGADAGNNLKSINGWNDTINNTDRFGFGALPGGRSGTSNTFYFLGNASFWWTANEHSQIYNALRRHLADDYDQSSRHGTSQFYGMSVRCIRNDRP